MSRTLVMTVLLAAWLATGIVAGIVMSYRRHDRFPWWLLGVAFAEPVNGSETPGRVVY